MQGGDLFDEEPFLSGRNGDGHLLADAAVLQRRAHRRAEGDFALGRVDLDGVDDGVLAAGVGVELEHHHDRAIADLVFVAMG